MKNEVLDLLRLLCNCDKGLGIPIPTGELRRRAGQLIKLGYADWIEAAGLRVYRATEDGRAAYQAHFKRFFIESKPTNP